MTLQNLPSVTFSSGRELIRIALAANQPILLIGDPGVGKSAIMYAEAARMGLPLFVLLGATLDPTDVGGLPVKSSEGDVVKRIPLEDIYECAARPGILFLDEISAAPGPVQAAFLRLILERKAGSVTLHPETRVVAACNPPEQAPAGFELSAPLMGRLTVVNFAPTNDEILDHFRTFGSSMSDASPLERAIFDEAQLFASIASATPDLLQIRIPNEAIQGGQAWGAPRACERLIRFRAAAQQAGIAMNSDAVFAGMAGAIGVRQATTYVGVLKILTELPTVDQIVSDPEGAACPDSPSLQVAALGLLHRIAAKNLWAAYIYALRIRPEFGVAAHKALLRLADKQPPLTDRWTQKGIKARAELSARVGGRRSDANS